VGRWAFKGRDFVFGNFLTISADLKILKQPNHVKHLRIFSTIFEILKTLPLKGGGGGMRGHGGHGDVVTRGRGDAGTRGREDAGTRGRGDVVTRGRGDAGTRGRGDAGTW
jgi:hypothetical protein